ncbi:MAG TPA: PAS domain-containing protein [Ramlibacter sp.]|nr:PAS domain-containing protein [Ramlibacter sp.]
MRRPLRDAGAVLAIVLLTGALLVFALLYQREAALRGGLQLTNSLSRVIAEQTARTFQSADQRLQLTILRLQALEESGGAGPEAIRALLAAEKRDLPFLSALWVTDAGGVVIEDSLGAGSRGASMADRPYFKAYREDPSTGFHIGPALRSRVTQHWMVNVARPIRAADGTLRGVLVGALEPAYFEQLWRGMDMGDTGAIALHHRNGTMLARTPAEPQLVGTDVSGTRLFREELQRASEGVFIRASALDGVMRVMAYRQLPTYPELVVIVGSGYDELLAPWRRFAALTSAVWAAAVLVAIALTWQLRRHARFSEESERRFRQLAQAVPQIVFIADGRGSVRFVSQRWAEVTGRTQDEAMGTRWQQAVHPHDRDRMVEQLAEGMATGHDLQVEHRLRYRDGRYRWQLLRAVPVREGEHPVVSWFGTATDIDALKKAQERLHAQAEQLRMAGRLTRMGSWRVDMATQRVTLSEEAAAVLDLPPDADPPLEELVAMLAPESVAVSLPAIRRCMEDGEPFDLEVEMVTAARRHVWIRTVGEAIRDEEGAIVGIQGAQQDITLRVLMMEEIRGLNASLEERIAKRTGELGRQEALFRTLAEQAPLPFWTVDPRGNVTFLSGAWYDLVGGAPPDWLGEEWMRLIHPDDVTSVQHNWLRSVVSGEPYAGTRRIRARDGTYHTMTYRAVPVRDADGVVLFWVGVDTDITDLMANEAALRLANKQLESFSYSVSHDLQSPLQRVGSFARLLQQELADAPPGRALHYLARIQANADTMAQLIEGLLALAHVSEVSLIATVVNLSDMATDILQHLQSEQPQRGVRWRVEPGLAVIGDTRLMRSVLENLLGNAWKFTTGRKEAEITVGGSRQRGEYWVRDNGVGFDMAYADRLFGTFQRLHAADEFPGTGIGLATVARAITRQGGRVWARSELGEGATFYFTLPPAATDRSE